jgi:ADP-ribosylglycohydrolase
MAAFNKILASLLPALAIATILAPIAGAQRDPRILTIDADVLEDKIRGGMLAQVIGNLNGLPHEFKYINEPGKVEHYTPSLPEGAQTDDDTDIEWVYLCEIARSGQTLVPSSRITELWKTHINRRIWCANKYARELMDLGFEPPWTGNVGLNPWSEFNISGQFVCESFGLMSPAMPQTAARTGLHYTRVTIDGEPAQATQLFTTMIAMAFVEDDINKLLDAGLAAVDSKSRIAEVVHEVRKMHAASPHDWQKARREIKKRWQTHGGEMRDRNGYELNTACTVAALLYGKKDFVETLRIAFNLGWDCDNNAATAATIIGVIRGRRWMNDQGWDIADVYRNTTRDNMPNDETLTGLENTLIQCARLAIEKQGGTPSEPAGSPRRNKRSMYQIRTETPANIEPLATSTDQLARLRERFLPQLDHDLAATGVTRARAAYLTICLGEVERLNRTTPAMWSAAVAELANYPALVQDLHQSPEPAGVHLRQQAEAAGLRPPVVD